MSSVIGGVIEKKGGLITYNNGLVESQKMIVKLIASNPSISKKEMSEKVGISTTAIDKNITTLKNKGLIKRVGSDRKGSWQVIPIEE